MNDRHHRLSYYIINGITLYRVIMAPVLMVLLFTAHIGWFRTLLVISFFTDAIDGFLARRFGVTSRFGTTLDSIGDDLTVAAAAIGLLVVHTDFVKAHSAELIVLFSLYLAQTLYALVRYGKLTGFHTRLAKAAAILQGIFLILSFFTGPLLWLYYPALIVTGLQLLEEMYLVYYFPQWTSNVKGLYWIWRGRKKNRD